MGPAKKKLLKEHRVYRFEMRVTETFNDALMKMLGQYPRDSKADIMHKALASFIRRSSHNFDKDTAKMCDQLEYNCVAEDKYYD